MTIGEKLSEYFRCKQENGVYEFKYVVDDGGIKKSKPFKGRLDHEFVAAEDGKDYIFGKQLKGRNIGICRVINWYELKNARFDIVKEETYYVFRAVLIGIAVHQCKMLSPIHIYTEDRETGLHVYGEALIDINYTRPIDNYARK